MELVALKDAKQELGPERYEQLEAGNILFFPETPTRLSPEDMQFLTTQRQSGASYHKNIAYRPFQDALTGVSRGGDRERLRNILKAFCLETTKLLTLLLPRYAANWEVDYASFRPLEEKGRDLSLHSRNDLLHFDSFPTRPTNGNRILRFFTNLNPSEPRVWRTTDGFEPLAERFAQEAGLLEIARRSGSPVRRRLARLARHFNFAPFRASPYDRMMHRFHNFLKENRRFQETCPKQQLEFPPGSSWVVFTDMVSHAVLSGQFALEQTFIVSRQPLFQPARAPVNILERLAGVPLTWSD